MASQSWCVGHCVISADRRDKVVEYFNKVLQRELKESSINLSSLTDQRRILEGDGKSS